MENKGIVFNIQRFSLHDGQGIRTNVFFKGCPLSCRWCANPESKDPEVGVRYDKTKCIGCGACVQACPNGGISMAAGGISLDSESCNACLSCAGVCPGHALYAEGEAYTAGELLAEALRDKHFFDASGGGVTLSGGEPLMQIDFVLEFLKMLKENGVHVVMETCGYSQRFAEVLPYVDVFYFDVKHPDGGIHREMTGKDNALILENLRAALGNGKEVVARIPVIPGLNDDADTWVQYVGLFKELGIKATHLLPFHQLGQEKYRSLGMAYAYDGAPSMDKGELEEMKEYFENGGIGAQIGG